MKEELSGGAKFGYLALGLFLNLIGVLIAWLVNKDKDQAIKSGAIKFSLIGFAIAVVLYIILFAVTFSALMAAYPYM